jgi:PBP1b-binding outer membrane lipoprotein LpoB
MFSTQRLPLTRPTKEHCWLVAAIFASAMLVLSCSTALVTENMVDVATTTDDLTTRQIIFNLVKIKKNAWALPSQVQITAGQVSGTTTINPVVAPAFFPSIATTIGTTSTSATVTNSTLTTRPATTTSLSATATDTDYWNTSFLQDPEQLRRLSLLYQYGAGQINAARLLCFYPIPEKSQNQKNLTLDPRKLSDPILGSDYGGIVWATGSTGPYTYLLSAGSLPPGLQLDKNTGAITGQATGGGAFTITASDTLGATGSRTYTVNLRDRNGKPEPTSTPKAPAEPEPANQQANSTKRYVRVGGQNETAFIVSCRPSNMTLVENPDPAFLHFPECILCEIDDPALNLKLKITLKALLGKGGKPAAIFKSSYALDQEAYNDQFTYVPVILNPRLLPNSVITSGASVYLPQTPIPDLTIDWLSVVKDGVEPIRNDAKRIGGSDGYTVYVHPVTSDETISGEKHFSEFVLAILEAVRQPAELQTVGATPPALTQSVGR